MNYEEQTVSYTNWQKGLYPTVDSAESAIDNNTMFVGKNGNGIYGCVVLNSIQPKEYSNISWIRKVNQGKCKIYYIDGERLKTGTKFFTPILNPAIKVLKKYDYNLPKITNQKGNEYLHLIQHTMGLRKSLTFHVARHSFATLAISHGVPIEYVARMLGHEDIHTTQIYTKILKTTINQYLILLRKAIK